MSQTITAIYADGVLRPLFPLDLPEQTQVEVEVKSVNEMSANPSSKPQATSVEERVRIHQALVDAGLVLERPVAPQPAVALSEAERDRLGHLFSADQPLSEIIIEERREGI